MIVETNLGLWGPEDDDALRKYAAELSLGRANPEHVGGVAAVSPWLAHDDGPLVRLIAVLAVLPLMAAWIGGGHPVSILWFLSHM